MAGRLNDTGAAPPQPPRRASGHGLRVAIVSSAFPDARPGGVATYVEGRAAQLARRCDVRVFALGDERHAGAARTVLGPHQGFRRRVIGVWWTLLVELWRYRPTYVEVHNIPVGLPLLLLWRAAYFFHGPAALEAQVEGVSGWRLVLSRWLENLVFRRAARIFVASEAYASLVRDIHPSRQASERKLRRRYPRLVPGGRRSEPAGDEASSADVDRHPDSPRDGRPLELVCVRRLVRRTGVVELVDAFVAAVDGGRLPRGTTLHVAGEGPMLPAIQARAADARDRVRIVVHGRVSDAVRERLYRGADFNLVPTQALEGFGLVVIEAALQGCPSLVTDVGALPEVLAQLDGIGLVCPRDRDSLGTALARLHRFSPDQRQQLARLAARRFLLARA